MKTLNTLVSLVSLLTITACGGMQIPDAKQLGNDSGTGGSPTSPDLGAPQPAVAPTTGTTTTKSTQVAVSVQVTDTTTNTTTTSGIPSDLKPFASIDQSRQYLMSIEPMDLTNAKAKCPDGWHIPSRAELLTASGQGDFRWAQPKKVIYNVWSSTQKYESYGYIVEWYLSLNSGVEHAADADSTSGYYAIYTKNVSAD